MRRPFAALAFLLVLPAAQCDRPPGDCLADELAKPGTLYTTWLDFCDGELEAEARQGSELGIRFAACVDEWEACRGTGSVGVHDVELVACPNGDNRWKCQARNSCCAELVVVATDGGCTPKDDLPSVCMDSFACDATFEACLRELE